eukprot:1136489-Pelagomonas_calceolata.AAC.1
MSMRLPLLEVAIFWESSHSFGPRVRLLSKHIQRNPCVLQEKFRLDLDDEAAVQWMQALLNESATALMPQIVETTHRWAQYWR